MTCPACGGPIPGDADRCPGCGQFLDGALDETRAGIPASAPPPVDAGEDEEDEEQPTIAADSLPEELRSGTKASYDALKPGEKIGARYEIVSVLGMGGMGVVYRAHDLSLAREVALKVIRPEMAKIPDIMERFRREILLASKVTHKNILRIHDLGEASGLSYISMNFVEGETLREVMTREGAMSVETGLPIALQLCQALQAAHEAGVVHRDLKPQNVLQGQDGTVYVADFGLSRSLDTGETMTKTGMILGTVDYMCPEQARGETPDHRGDIYSFGIILYEMFSGQLPFRADTALGSMMKRIHEDVPSLRKKLPPWLARIVARCLMRDPADRYQSAAEILKDLNSQKVSMAWRRWRRPRFLLRAAGILLAAGLVVAGAVLGVRWFLARGPAADVAPRASLAVLPFQNSTGDPRYDWVGTGLPDLVRTDLQQTRALRLIGQDRVDGVLGAMKVGADGVFRPDSLARISSVLGVDGLLTGSLMRAGDRFLLDVNLQRAGGGPPASIRVQGAGEDSLFSMVDDLTKQVRDELGLSAGWGESDRGVTELSTDSVEALRLYSEGRALVRAGNMLDAVDRLEGAVKEDEGFVAAHALLAETYDRLGYKDKAVAAVERAAGHLKGASPVEATSIRAVQARLSNDLTGAEAAYRELVRFAPNDADAQMKLASVLEDEGKLDEAFATLQKVISLDPKHPDGHYALGRVMVKQGDSFGALNEFNTSLSLHVEAGNDEGRATVLNGLGNAYSSLGRYDEAMDYFQQALTIRERIGDRRGVGVTLNNMANLLLYQGNYEQAIATQKKVIEIGDEIGDQAGNGEAYSNLGEIYLEAGRPEDALAAYRESLRIVRELGDEAGLAWNLSSIGVINSVLGDYLESYFFLKEALDKRRELGDKREIVRSLIDLSYLEVIQGRQDEARKYIVEGLDLARETGNKAAIVVLTANMANLQEIQGDYGSALKSLTDAEDLAGELGDADLQVTIRAYEGNVLREIGDGPGATAMLDEALTGARGLGNAERLSEVQAYRGALLSDLGERDAAAKALVEATTAAKQSGNHWLQLLARLRTAEISGDAKNLETAVQEAEKAGLGPLVGIGRLGLARLHLAAGSVAAAGEDADRAIRAATPLGQRDVLLQGHRIAGRSRMAAADPAGAIAHYASALKELEEMRANLEGKERALFLKRPATQEFARDASAAFEAQGKTAESVRLSTALAP